MPITANINMIMTRTKVRFDSAPTVRDKMFKISLRDFHDFANLNTLNNLNERSIDNPETPSARSSTKERRTISMSNMFQPS